MKTHWFNIPGCRLTKSIPIFHHQQALEKKWKFIHATIVAPCQKERPPFPIQTFLAPGRQPRWKQETHWALLFHYPYPHWEVDGETNFSSGMNPISWK